MNARVGRKHHQWLPRVARRGFAASARRGRSRSLVIAAAVVVLTGAIASAVWAATPSKAAPTRSVDRTLSSYVLFAKTSLQFQGASTAGNGRGYVTGGDVGVNNGSMSACANNPMITDDGSQVVANALHGDGGECSFWDVFTNALTGSPTLIPRHSGPNPFMSPIMASSQFPTPPPDKPCNSAKPIVVSSGGVRILSPSFDASGNTIAGSYGAVQVQNGGSLFLSNGTYRFCDFSLASNGHLFTKDATVVHVASSFSVGPSAVVGPSCKARFFVDSLGLTSGAITVVFSRFVTVAGFFWAPNGQLQLGHHSDLTGFFGADTMGSDLDVNVGGCGGNPPPTTTTSATLPPTTVRVTLPTTSTTTTSTTTTATTTTVPNVTTTTISF